MSYKIDIGHVQMSKIANHPFCAVQPINNSKKQNNCLRQSFRADLENVRNTGIL